MNTEKLLRMIGAVLDEARTQIRSMPYPNGISVGLGELHHFLERQAEFTRQMYQDQCRESECSCYKCGHHFWLTMPLKQERELGTGLPETCIECWEAMPVSSWRAEGSKLSGFRDQKFRYRRETNEEAIERTAKEN